MGEVILGLFVQADAECVGNSCSNQAWLNAYPKPFQAVAAIDMPCALVKAPIKKQLALFVGPYLRDLEHGLDDILRI